MICVGWVLFAALLGAARRVFQIRESASSRYEDLHPPEGASCVFPIHKLRPSVSGCAIKEARQRYYKRRIAPNMRS